jgi:hypothetical protein
MTIKNVEIEEKGNTITIKVDKSKTFGPSVSGKTIIVATTGGNIDIGGVYVGLNVYKSIKKGG